MHVNRNSYTCLQQWLKFLLFSWLPNLSVSFLHSVLSGRRQGKQTHMLQQQLCSAQKHHQPIQPHSALLRWLYYTKVWLSGSTTQLNRVQLYGDLKPFFFFGLLTLREYYHDTEQLGDQHSVDLTSTQHRRKNTSWTAPEGSSPTLDLYINSSNLWARSQICQKPCLHYTTALGLAHVHSSCLCCRKQVSQVGSCHSRPSGSIALTQPHLFFFCCCLFACLFLGVCFVFNKFRAFVWICSAQNEFPCLDYLFVLFQI